jgi:hypothetical protein
VIWPRILRLAFARSEREHHKVLLMTVTTAIDRELDTRVRLLDLAAKFQEKHTRPMPSEDEVSDTLRLLFMAKQSGVPVSLSWHMDARKALALDVAGGFATADGEVYRYRRRDRRLATLGSASVGLASSAATVAAVVAILAFSPSTTAFLPLAVLCLLAGVAGLFGGATVAFWTEGELRRRFRRSAIRAELAPEEARRLVREANRVRALMRAASPESSGA